MHGAINGNPQSESVGLKRSLRFRDPVLYGDLMIAKIQHIMLDPCIEP